MGIKDKDLCVHIYENMKFGVKKNDIYVALEWIKKQDYFWWYDDENFTRDSGTTCSSVPLPYSDLNAAVKSSNEVQYEWENKGFEERNLALHVLVQELQSKRKLFSSLYSLLGQRDEFDLFLEYFNFYSGMVINIPKPKPNGPVLMVFLHGTPSWFLAATSAAALWAGCSVIIISCGCNAIFPFLLADICSTAGLPNKLITVVLRDVDYHNNELFTLGVRNIVFGGNFTEKQFPKYHHYLTNHCELVHLSVFNFGRTSFIVFDSCDVNGTVDKLFYETWESEEERCWAASLVLVQESICGVFLQKLTNKMKKIRKDEYILKGKNQNFDVEKIFTEAEGVRADVFVANDTKSNQILITEYEIDVDGPITTLLVFKSAKEAVDIVNKSPYCIGTSIWTEKMAEVMEVSSQLETPTIWVNCHGVISADVPVQVFRKSGTGVFGGVDGGFSYMISSSESKCINERNPTINSNQTVTSEFVKRISQLSHKSFTNWKSNKNRKNSLIMILNALKNDKRIPESIKLVKEVLYWLSNGNSCELTMNAMKDNLYMHQLKKSIGVIEMVLDVKDDLVRFVSWVTPAILMGNTVIVVLDEASYSNLKHIIQCFLEHVPHGVVNVVKGTNYAGEFAKDANIKAVWMQHSLYDPRISEICFISKMKFLWVVPEDIENYKMIFAKNCLKNQAVWFPQINPST